MKAAKLASVLIALLFLIPLIVAHADDIPVYNADNPWESPSTYIIIVSIFLIAMTFFILTFGKKLALNNKKLFFWLMVLPIIFSSVYLAGYTVYENVISESNGPVHWHADYQVHVCGERLDLIDPRFPRNKIGLPLLHEHDDDRIHIEGTVRELHDIDLGSYFKSINGRLENGVLIYKTNARETEVKDGDKCNSVPGKLKVYVNGERINDYDQYLIYPDPNVPPGDCIVILFDETNEETTDILCESWEVQGWTYENYKRRPKAVGDYSWQ